MTTIITVVHTLFALDVRAADVCHELGEGSSDLSAQRLSAEDLAGIQPGTGDSAPCVQTAFAGDFGLPLRGIG